MDNGIFEFSGYELKSLKVSCGSDAAVAAAWAKTFAHDCGLGAQSASELAIAASELATNMLRHAGGGVLEADVLNGFLELRALDRGPGMKHPEMLFSGSAARGEQDLVPGVHRPGLGEGGASLLRLCDQATAQAREGGGLEVLVRKRLS